MNGNSPGSPIRSASGQVVLGVERLDRLAGHRGEERVALGRRLVALAEPALGVRHGPGSALIAENSLGRHTQGVTDMGSAELAEAAFAALARHDFDGFLDLMDPDVEFTSLILESEAKVYCGHAGVRQFLDQMLSVFPDWTPEVESTEPYGDDAVLVKVRFQGTGARQRDARRAGGLAGRPRPGRAGDRLGDVPDRGGGARRAQRSTWKPLLWRTSPRDKVAPTAAHEGERTDRASQLQAAPQLVEAHDPPALRARHALGAPRRGSPPPGARRRAASAGRTPSPSRRTTPRGRCPRSAASWRIASALPSR